MRGFRTRVAYGCWLLSALPALTPTASLAVQPSELEHQLNIDGRPVSLTEAMDILNVPSVSFAVIDDDRIAFASAYGEAATPETLFQAASLSKFVTAVGAMRMVGERGASLILAEA